MAILLLPGLLPLPAMLGSAPAPTVASMSVAGTAVIEAAARAAFEAADVPGAAMVVVYGDEVVWSGGFGETGAGESVTPGTRFAAASLTKSFTATVALDLAVEGRIRLDAPLAEQLPDFRMRDDRAASITVRQLLDHTSGLSDAGVRYWAAIDGGLADGAALLAMLTERELTDAPGSRHRYANVNYDLVGELVAHVTGRPFDDALAERVLAPLGLDDTVLDRTALPPGHVSLFGAWVPRVDGSSDFVTAPSGALATSAADLGSWLIAANGRGSHPLPSGVRAVTDLAPIASDGYSAGWHTVDGRPGWRGHSGNAYTYSSAMQRDPVTGWGAAVLVNGAAVVDPAWAVAGALVAAALGERQGIDDGIGDDTVDVPSARTADRWAAPIAIGVVGLGIAGAVRAMRWARRVGGRPRRAALGWAWPIAVLAAVGSAPSAAGLVSGGIQISWSMLTWYTLTPLVTLLLTASAALATVTARLVATRRAGRARTMRS